LKRTHQLGDLQLAIMRVLWSRGEASVSDVHEALRSQGGRALTTIATMLTKMERKGVVAHRADGRVFVYRPTVTEAAVQRSMVAELMGRLFEGDPTALVSHLLTAQEIERADLERLKALIAEHAAADAKKKDGRHGR
jgi:predicted transcriptional regulator